MRNADFTVAQRGVALDNVVSGFTLDRWFLSHGAGANRVSQQAGFCGSERAIRIERFAGGPVGLYQCLPSNESRKYGGGYVTFGIAARGDGALSVKLIGGKGNDQTSPQLGGWAGQATLGEATFMLGAAQRCAVTVAVPPDVTQLALYLSWTGALVEFGAARLSSGLLDLASMQDNDAEEIACRTYFERLNRVLRPSIIAPLMTYNAYAGSGRVSFTPKRHDNYTLGLSGSMSDYHVLRTDGAPILPTKIELDGHAARDSFWVRVEWLHGGLTIPGGCTYLVSDATPTSRFDVDADL